ncbi:cytochrome P450 [Rhodococcus koreensis]
MNTEHLPEGAGTKQCPVAFNRHDAGYREQFEQITEELHQKCPVAWSDSYDGHWVAAGMSELFEIARRSDVLSNDNDFEGKRKGYQGISIPPPNPRVSRGGFLEMDPPEQQDYRKTLNPYLSPAAVARWIPVIDEITRAAIDERIETGEIDFIDHLANVVPAVVTMGLLGVPLKDWELYCDPVHASVYTPPGTPEKERVAEQLRNAFGGHMLSWIGKIKEDGRPGLINALNTATINGEPASTFDILSVCSLLVGGGFDTTTALTGHSIEWLSENPEERKRLHENLDTMLDSATEEFLRYYTPAVGDGRTITQDVEIAGAQFKEGDRIWLSWAMANRTEDVFPNPNTIDLERTGNRHASFGLGQHRCIGSNVARNLFKRMLTHVLDRMPDYVCDKATTKHYTTVGVINGLQSLPATFTPGIRRGPGLEETIEKLQKRVDEEQLAAPITNSKGGRAKTS